MVILKVPITKKRMVKFTIFFESKIGEVSPRAYFLILGYGFFIFVNSNI